MTERKKHKTAWESEGFKLLEAGWYGLEGIVHRDSDYIRALEAALDNTLDQLWKVNTDVEAFTESICASVGWDKKGEAK